MGTATIPHIVCAVVFAHIGVGLASLSTVVWSDPGDGLAGTKHDFSTLGGMPQFGLCTACHTPHNAQIQSLLWNHTLSANTFSWSDPQTVGGTDYPNFTGAAYNGATAKCLSCHDGSVAIGDVGWWNGGGPVSVLNTKLSGAFQIASATGDMNGNHPVAMPFPWNGVASTYNGSTTGASALVSGWQADPDALGLRLFTDDGVGNITSGATLGQTGFECSSCHDPHNGSGVQDRFFLRGVLGGSSADYICVKCHAK